MLCKIIHLDWLIIVKGFGTANETALFRHSLATIYKKFADDIGSRIT